MIRKIASNVPMAIIVVVLFAIALLTASSGQTSETQSSGSADSISAFHGGDKKSTSMMGMKEITPEQAIPLELYKEANRGNKPKLNLFYIGRRRSELEPCGCKVKQLGGVQYEQSLYDSLGDGADVKLDAGEWSNAMIMGRPEYALKTSYLLRSFQLMDLDAVNVSLNPLAMGKGYLDMIEKQYPGAMSRLLSANIFMKDQPEKTAFDGSRILTRKLGDGTMVKIGVIGAVSLVRDQLMQRQIELGQKVALEELEIEDFIVRDPQPAVAAAIEQLRPQVDLLILLFAGMNDETMRMAESFDQLDYVVTTGIMTPQALEGTFTGTRILEPVDSLGKHLSHMALEYQGDKQWTIAQATQVHDIYTGLPEAEKLAGLIESYKTKTQELTVTRPAKVEYIYSGANRCSLCHQAEYADWKQSAHAHAVNTLVRENQQYNPECLECHVTGYRNENGFYSVSDPQSRLMYDVQCEVCHGPGKAHADSQQKIKSGAERWMTPEQFAALQAEVKATMPKKAVAEETCRKCHTEKTTPDEWTYHEKVKLIDHSAALR